MTALLKVEKELVSNVTRPCTPLHQPIVKLPRLVLAADCRCWLGTATKFCKLIGLKDESAGLLDQAALPEWSADDTLQHGRHLPGWFRASCRQIWRFCSWHCSQLVPYKLKVRWQSNELQALWPTSPVHNPRLCLAALRH